MHVKALAALLHQTLRAASQSHGLGSLPPDAAVQQQPQAIVGEVAEAVPDALDLLIWNGAVKWEPPVSSSWCPHGASDSRWPVGGGRARVGQDRVGAAWIGGPPL
jgi:hypothetical protein